MCTEVMANALTSSCILWPWDMTLRSNAARLFQFCRQIWGIFNTFDIWNYLLIPGDDISVMSVLPVDRYPLMLCFGRQQAGRPRLLSQIVGMLIICLFLINYFIL
jgi:hypothetical protein